MAAQRLDACMRAQPGACGSLRCHTYLSKWDIDMGTMGAAGGHRGSAGPASPEAAAGVVPSSFAVPPQGNVALPPAAEQAVEDAAASRNTDLQQRALELQALLRCGFSGLNLSLAVPTTSRLLDKHLWM